MNTRVERDKPIQRKKETLSGIERPYKFGESASGGTFWPIDCECGCANVSIHNLRCKEENARLTEKFLKADALELPVHGATDESRDG
jgi:hypothetical protein